jgi:hypothetical protein
MRHWGPSGGNDGPESGGRRHGRGSREAVASFGVLGRWRQDCRAAGGAGVVSGDSSGPGGGDVGGT